jgi:hypothetical protein
MRKTSGSTATLIERENAAGVLFVILELERGLIYCMMASSADTERKARRHAANDNRCYQVATFHVETLFLTLAEQIDFDQKEKQQKHLL